MKKQFLIAIVLLLSVPLFAEKDADGYEILHCDIIPFASKKVKKGSYPLIPGPRSLDKRAPTNQMTSTNWAGYVGVNNVLMPTRNSVSAVAGSWIIPALRATTEDAYAAYWVGIDGYSSPTVEQIGTAHEWINGAQVNYAWFEMYPAGSYSINGFPLKPGDTISASVVYSGNSIFTLVLKNITQRVITTIPTQYTYSSVALRQSAEWIVEAPYYQEILPLADFVRAYLFNCTATINGVTAPIGNNFWKNIAISMVDDNGMLKAITSPLLPDNKSFYVTWMHV